MQHYVCPTTWSTLNLHMTLSETISLLNYLDYIISEFDYDDYLVANIRAHLEQGIATIQEHVEEQETPLDIDVPNDFWVDSTDMPANLMGRLRNEE